MCPACWAERNPDRLAVRVVAARARYCCFCQIMTDAGIFVRESPVEAPCGGVRGHETDD